MQYMTNKKVKNYSYSILRCRCHHHHHRRHHDFAQKYTNSRTLSTVQKTAQKGHKTISITVHSRIPRFCRFPPHFFRHGDCYMLYMSLLYEGRQNHHSPEAFMCSDAALKPFGDKDMRERLGRAGNRMCDGRIWRFKKSSALQLRFVHLYPCPAPSRCP